MKKLMLGNEALARGLYEAGCALISSYPGTPSTEVTEYATNYDEIYTEWAPNEKVAMETAFGASLAGKRSACCMKHVGLNVAADPLFTISYTGVNAGMVIVVADDPGMHSSQNEQDSRHHAIASKVPMLEPSDPVEAKEFAAVAFELSEKYDTPVFIRTCTRIAHSQCEVEMSERTEPPLKDYVKDPAKYIMSPANAIAKHPVVEERTAALRKFSETSSLNRIEMAKDTTLGIITSGTCYEYVKEVFGDSVCVLKIGMVNPLPDAMIRQFASEVDKLVVIEELDPIIEEHCKVLGLDCHGKDMFPIIGEFFQSTVREAFGLPMPQFVEDPVLPARPPVMCAGCPHRGLFYVLAKNRFTVFGDIGCYTLGSSAPLNAVDTVLCMGESLGGIHGFNKIRGEESQSKTVSVIGDSTFMHSGMTGLANIAYNASNSTVIIADNSTTGMTGHQNNPTNGFNIKGEPANKIDLVALVKAMGIDHVRIVDPYDLKETEKAVLEEAAFDGPSVIISRRPCALLKSTKLNPPLKVDEDKCQKCKQCMKIGCPAISMDTDHAVIDATQCVGCGVCSQMCKFDAIGGGEA